MCLNDCLLYRGERDEDETVCRICGASRWKLNKKGEEVEGISAKVLWYFPLIPRLRNLFNITQIAKDMTWHKTERQNDGKIRHSADSKTWKDVDQRWPEFATEARNLQLALSSDGFNHFHGPGSDHSTWTVLLLIYNLPPWLCMKRKYIILSMLIPGPNQPGNDIDVYLQPLIEVLQKLWHGKQVFDAFKKESFILRGILLWTISDYPALGNLSGNIIKGYNAFVVFVDDKTKSTRLANYKKTVVMRHCRWLPRNHPYRRQKSAFDNTVEKLSTHIPLTGEKVLERKKNECEALTVTLLIIPGKTKDREFVRVDMAEMEIRMELRQKNPGKKEKLPVASWNLLHKEKKMFSIGGDLMPDRKALPPSLFDVMIHLSVHLVREVELCGPVFLRWMYLFERYMKMFKGYVRNRAHPEGCIAEAYIAEEVVECLVNFEEPTIGLPDRDKNKENTDPYLVQQ
ncbi:uncharacterized protein LOC141714553 [Apium graveolens]|uniref:uncharacterized protein LOC141714553 n=1 Tax=Apium graveolens TaxID=4045 RepID=UPI003D7A5C85